ncbi:MAG: HD domain-containing protein [Sporichthyaceae bacterium]
MLGHRYAAAVADMVRVHRGQVRKGTDVPYAAHLLAVSSLVLEAGGAEDQAIAGLFHDALEDQGHRIGFEEIEERYGTEVAAIVRACSDTEVVPKPPWTERKKAYLAHLETAEKGVLLVSLADKLHNARSIATDLETHGDALWARFNQGAEPQRWYYGALAEVFGRVLPCAQSNELARLVERMGPVR